MPLAPEILKAESVTKARSLPGRMVIKANPFASKIWRFEAEAADTENVMICRRCPLLVPGTLKFIPLVTCKKPLLSQAGKPPDADAPKAMPKFPKA